MFSLFAVPLLYNSRILYNTRIVYVAYSIREVDGMLVFPLHCHDSIYLNTNSCKITNSIHHNCLWWSNWPGKHLVEAAAVFVQYSKLSTFIKSHISFSAMF